VSCWTTWYRDFAGLLASTTLIRFDWSATLPCLPPLCLSSLKFPQHWPRSSVIYLHHHLLRKQLFPFCLTKHENPIVYFLFHPSFPLTQCCTLVGSSPFLQLEVCPLHHAHTLWGSKVLQAGSPLKTQCGHFSYNNSIYVYLMYHQLHKVRYQILQMCMTCIKVRENTWKWHWDIKPKQNTYPRLVRVIL